eukprot:COSAG05_NODE_1355_length_5107_cov_3.586062_2_plen_132_part_00
MAPKNVQCVARRDNGACDCFGHAAQRLCRPRGSVYENRNDASKNADTHFGAAGGWFRLWNDNLVCFFCEEFPPELVARESSSQLEMRTQTIAARLIGQFHEPHGPRGDRMRARMPHRVAYMQAWNIGTQSR